MSLDDEPKSDSNSTKKRGWEDLVFSTIERIAAAPQKLRDPKESVAAAFEWMKGVKGEIQDRISEEVQKKVTEIDWDRLSREVGTHIAENFDVEITTKVRFVPRAKDPAQKND